MTHSVLNVILLQAALCILQGSASMSISNGSLESSCGTGEYLHGGVQCVPCYPGTYCPSATERNPRKCHQGYYSGWSATKCTECPAGWACPSPDARPQKCLEGQYSYKRSLSCSAITEGHYAEIDGSLGFCRGGQYCPAGTDVAPEVCAAGTACDGKSTRTTCSAGEYSLQGSSACINCPPGYKCPSGYQDHPPQVCPPGYYGSGTNQIDCTECSAGFYCVGASHPPAECPAGYFSRAGFKECIACPAGFECQDPAAYPTVCPEEKYSEEGWQYCAYCPAGFECLSDNVQGLSHNQSPVACDPGYYSLEGERYCTKCPIGHHCPRANYTPQRCEPGQYTPTPGATTCTDCPLGMFCSNHNAPASECQPRTHAMFKKSSICTKTPQGHYTLNDYTGYVKCPEGQITDKYQFNEGESCFDCPKGYACPGSSWDMIMPCPEGTWSEDGMLSCMVADPGTYVESGDTRVAAIKTEDGYFTDVGFSYQVKCYHGWDCAKELGSSIYNSGRHNVICPPGHYYSDITQATTTCSICPVGYYCPLEIGDHRALNYKIECPIGSYAEQQGQTECRPCPPGHECPSDNTGDTSNGQAVQGLFTYAQPCADGWYQAGGSYECFQCPEGYECTWHSVIATCPPFFYSPLGEANCRVCTDGYECIHANDDGAVADFTDPDKGYAIRELKKQDPVLCPDGYYAGAFDQFCQPAPKGHAASPPVAEPTACDPGYYASQVGQGTCTICPDGYSSDYGAEYCIPVPRGFGVKVDNTGTVVTPGIELCEQGTYSDLGDEVCTDCPDGFLCPQMTGEYGLSMYSCPRGSYCNGGEEFKCPAGSFGTRERAFDQADGCELCPPGYDCPAGTPDYHLHPCPQGAYCEQASSLGALDGVRPSNMQRCPEGSYRAETHGRSEGDCQLCPAGFKCDEGQKDRGTPCPEAYYCGIGNAELCPPGTHGAYKTNKVSPDQCLPCPPGHYCPYGIAEEAPAGYYTSQVGIATIDGLHKCPPGFHCTGVANAIYKGRPCAPGYFCPAGTSEYQLDANKCPEGTWSDRIDLHDATHCSPCPPGYRCDAGSNTSNGLITDCPEHSFCPSGTALSDTAYCPAGTYSPYLNSRSMADCLACPAGSYCLSDGNGPQTCDTGHYCPPGTRTATQYPCEPGYYNDVTGGTFKQSCKRCGLNQYCPGWGNTSPTPCAAGYYVNEITNAEVCNQCPAGYYCLGSTAAQANPVACAAGLYSRPGGSSDSDCLNCEVGHYCPFQGISYKQMIENRCPEGTFCSMYDAATGSVETGLNVYPNHDQFCDADGSGICTNGSACDIDKYCPLGTTVQYDIPPGTVQRTYARGLLSEVLSMPAGFYTTQMDDPCPVGQYCPSGSSAPVDCPAGTYRDDLHGKDVSDCGLCPAGTFCPYFGTSQPLPCGPGKFCPEGSIFESDCPRGTYNTGLGLYDSRECTPCDAGHFCPMNGQDFDPTFYGSAYCCDSGFVCYSGSERPEPTDEVKGDYCAVGGFCPGWAANDGEAQTKIDGTWYGTEIDGVTYAAADTTTYPNICYTEQQACAKGKFGLYAGAQQSEECVTCWPGYYCSGASGNDAKKACQAGVYCTGAEEQPYPGLQTFYKYTQLTYDGASEGQEGIISGSEVYVALDLGIICNLCDSYVNYDNTLGTYSDEAGHSTCCVNSAVQVDKTFNVIDGDDVENTLVETVAILDADGYNTAWTTYTTYGYVEYWWPPGVADQSIISTDNGYASTNEASLWDDQVEKTRAYVIEAPQGYYCPEACQEPLSCPIGQHSYDEGSVECTPCPVGKWCPYAATAEAEMISCPQGFWCSTHTLDMLQLQLANEADNGCSDDTCSDWDSTLWAYEPHACEKGTYNPITGASAITSCVDCPEFYACNEQAMVGADSTGTEDFATYLVRCAAGFFCTAASPSTHPFDSTSSLYGNCPAGSYCPQVDSNGDPVNAVPCPDGTFSNQERAISEEYCMDCPPGWLCQGTGLTTASSECDFGFMCSENTAVTCSTTGYICPLGSHRPLQCPSGYYQLSPSKAVCIECLAGQYCMAGQTSSCQEGYYCP